MFTVFLRRLQFDKMFPNNFRMKILFEILINKNLPTGKLLP